MTLPSINPVAKALYLCDGHLGFDNRKADLMGIFNSIRPAAYPHVNKGFNVFAQLISGLGQVSFHIAIRSAATEEVIYTSNTGILIFPRRMTVVQMACTIGAACVFPQPGIYLVELYCNGQWVADTTLDLL